MLAFLRRRCQRRTTAAARALYSNLAANSRLLIAERPDKPRVCEREERETHTNSRDSSFRPPLGGSLAFGSIELGVCLCLLALREAKEKAVFEGRHTDVREPRRRTCSMCDRSLSTFSIYPRERAYREDGRPGCLDTRIDHAFAVSQSLTRIAPGRSHRPKCHETQPTRHLAASVGSPASFTRRHDYLVKHRYCCCRGAQGTHTYENRTVTPSHPRLFFSHSEPNNFRSTALIRLRSIVDSVHLGLRRCTCLCGGRRRCGLWEDRSNKNNPNSKINRKGAPYRKPVFVPPSRNPCVGSARLQHVRSLATGHARLDMRDLPI